MKKILASLVLALTASGMTQVIQPEPAQVVHKQQKYTQEELNEALNDQAKDLTEQFNKILRRNSREWQTRLTTALVNCES